MMKARGRLLMSGAYSKKAYDQWFEEGMKEISKWHASRNSFYNEWLKDGLTEEESWSYLPASMLKECPTISVPKFKVVKTLQSSGTSGRRSKLILDGKSYREGRYNGKTSFVARGMGG